MSAQLLFVSLLLADSAADQHVQVMRSAHGFQLGHGSAADEI
jgi:hypothetical protein